MRNYPHIDDFELTVQESEGWLSKHWDKARLAEQRPRNFLDWWLGCEWVNLSEHGYKEPEKVYNPKQLSNFIEQYFNNSELVERITRGKHDGYSDSLATKHYEKALGHAVKLREEVPDFPQTPEAMGKPHLDLRRLQEWCIKCQKIANELLAGLTIDHVEKALSLLLDLRQLLDSGFPPIDETIRAKTGERVRRELESLIEVIGELDEPETTVGGVTATAQFGFKAWRWSEQATLGGDCEPLLRKMKENGIYVPDNKEELAEMISAAESMAKTDWKALRALEEAVGREKAMEGKLDRLASSSWVLSTAQTAEQQISKVVWMRYCRENPDYNTAYLEAWNREGALYDEAAATLNSNRVLLRISFLRDNRLESAFKRLYDSLFSTSTLRPKPDESLQEAVDELEAIRDDAEKYDVFTKPAETEPKISPVKDSKKTTS